MKVTFFVPAAIPADRFMAIADWPAGHRLPVVGDHVELVYRLEEVELSVDPIKARAHDGIVHIRGAVIDVVWRRVPSGNDAFWSAEVHLKW